MIKISGEAGQGDIDITVEFSGITPSERAQLMTLVEAFDIFRARNRRYADLWMQGGTADSLGHMKSKLARMEQDGHLTVEERINNVHGCHDEPLDMINFAAFYLRNTRDGRIT